jgi:hypothetical protein
MKAENNDDTCRPAVGFCYNYQPRHKHFRSEDDLARDLSRILGLPLTLKTKVDVINSFLWAWTERYGKHEGRVVSKAASSHEAVHGHKGLIHDHAVPRKAVTEMLLHLKSPSADDVHRILKEYCEGVLVTKDEDSLLSKAGLRSRMPKNWDGKDCYARYKAVGIQFEERIH